MQRIFIRVDISNTNIDCNERRRNGPISSNPYRTGQIFPPSALRPLDGALLHQRERALPDKKICLRRIRAVTDDTP